MNKKIMWLVIGCGALFGGWILKDVPHSKPIGQASMSLGFLIIGILLFFQIREDVHKP